MKLKKNTRLEIFWHDILSVSAWRSEEEASKVGAAKCKSLGYFLNEDDEFIRISSCVGHDDELGNERNVTIIPKGCITKIRRLR